ncbi:MAG TPA: type II toxin-antitoxin system VapC family toxin [Sporichthya sp.]|nr:type II toxin-antitoxin system VapC family toxin [Sporichthya sp.]
MQLVIDTTSLVTVALSDSPDLLAAHELRAPALIRSEALSALHEGLWRGAITEAVALTARDRVLGARVRLFDDRVLHRTAWDVAERFGLAKTHDASYVALARLRKIPLLTGDLRMRRWAHGYVDMLTLDEI